MKTWNSNESCFISTCGDYNTRVKKANRFWWCPVHLWLYCIFHAKIVVYRKNLIYFYMGYGVHEYNVNILIIIILNSHSGLSFFSPLQFKFTPDNVWKCGILRSPVRDMGGGIDGWKRCPFFSPPMSLTGLHRIHMWRSKLHLISCDFMWHVLFPHVKKSQ